MDTLTPQERSERMSRIRGEDTNPEMRLRHLVHGMGYRYRLHVKALPGKPDLVFPSRRYIIFMHGCFWHRHRGCRLARMPKSRVAFWRKKLDDNKRRDEENLRLLGELGWRVMVVWECELQNAKDLEKVAAMVSNFLDHETGDQVDEIG